MEAGYAMRQGDTEEKHFCTSLFEYKIYMHLTWLEICVYVW